MYHCQSLSWESPILWANYLCPCGRSASKKKDRYLAMHENFDHDLDRPLDCILSTSLAKYARDHLPGMLAVLAPPVTREGLAKAAVSAALGDIPTTASSSTPATSSSAGLILTVEDLKKYEAP